MDGFTVSTHSRPKAAAFYFFGAERGRAFQHTAARRRLQKIFSISRDGQNVSTHSRPKAADKLYELFRLSILFQHTAARRRLASSALISAFAKLFQHTAARRRLLKQAKRAKFAFKVSTHSRPKAAEPTISHTAAMKLFQHTAARRRLDFHGLLFNQHPCFNTQPPEGGCREMKKFFRKKVGFNTQPPEGG